MSETYVWCLEYGYESESTGTCESTLTGYGACSQSVFAGVSTLLLGLKRTRALNRDLPFICCQQVSLTDYCLHRVFCQTGYLGVAGEVDHGEMAYGQHQHAETGEK